MLGQGLVNAVGLLPELNDVLDPCLLRELSLDAALITHLPLLRQRQGLELFLLLHHGHATSCMAPCPLATRQVGAIQGLYEPTVALKPKWLQTLIPTHSCKLSLIGHVSAETIAMQSCHP